MPTHDFSRAWTMLALSLLYLQGPAHTRCSINVSVMDKSIYIQRYTHTYLCCYQSVKKKQPSYFGNSEMILILFLNSFSISPRDQDASLVWWSMKGKKKPCTQDGQSWAGTQFYKVLAV